MGLNSVRPSPTPADPARARAVQRMFADIARRYDFLNHLLSAGLDHRWRSRAAAACPSAPAQTILDLCAGTGDLTLALLKRLGGEGRVIACDFSRPMLARARAKVTRAGLARRVVLLEADALRLPLADASVDGVVCGFGLRNLADPAQGLSEMVRVVRPGGRTVVLEFHRPDGRGLLAAAFRLYFRRALPTLGERFSGSHGREYQYLVRSIEAFGPAEATAAAMRAAGIARVRVEPLPGNVASVLVGTRAP